MSLKDVKDFISDPKSVFAFFVAVGSVLYGWIKKKPSKIASEKNEIERDTLRYNLQVKKDNHDLEQQVRKDEKIESLTRKLGEITDQLDVLTKQLREANVLIEELKSENTVYKTVKSK